MLALESEEFITKLEFRAEKLRYTVPDALLE